MPYLGEIWNVNQIDSAKNSDPKQPSDVSKQFRPHIVIGVFRLYGTQRVTVIPIQSNKPDIAFKVQIDPSKENGLANSSWTLCSEIFTINGKYLIGPRIGILNTDDFDLIKDSIRAYLTFLIPVK